MIMWGAVMQYLWVNFFNFSLVGSSAEQNLRMWGMSSTSDEHSLEKKQTPALFWDQLLQSFSLRYLPDNINACVTAIEILAGDDPAVCQIGCGFDSDINFGLK